MRTFAIEAKRKDQKRGVGWSGFVNDAELGNCDSQPLFHNLLLYRSLCIFHTCHLVMGRGRVVLCTRMAQSTVVVAVEEKRVKEKSEGEE